MILRKMFLILFFALFTDVSFCLEISISGAIERIDEAPKSKTASGNIIFVDMEKVFNSHPMTLEYKEKIKNFAKMRKDIIGKLVEELNLLNERIRNIDSKISEAKSKNESKESKEKLSMELDDARKLRDAKKREILDLSERTKNEMALMEEKDTAEVLKNIESLLKVELKKYDAAIVLDKQGVVTEKCKDVTNEVIKMGKDK
jgi:hypothetical protein